MLRMCALTIHRMDRSDRYSAPSSTNRNPQSMRAHYTHIRRSPQPQRFATTFWGGSLSLSLSFRLHQHCSWYRAVILSLRVPRRHSCPKARIITCHFPRNSNSHTNTIVSIVICHRPDKHVNALPLVRFVSHLAASQNKTQLTQQRHTLVERIAQTLLTLYIISI